MLSCVASRHGYVSLVLFDDIPGSFVACFTISESGMDVCLPLLCSNKCIGVAGVPGSGSGCVVRHRTAAVRWQIEGLRVAAEASGSSVPVPKLWRAPQALLDTR